PSATPYLYALSLPDALPILESGIGEDVDHHLGMGRREWLKAATRCHDRFNSWPGHASILIQSPSVSLCVHRRGPSAALRSTPERSEEHTSELQSRFELVCRL